MVLQQLSLAATAQQTQSEAAANINSTNVEGSGTPAVDCASGTGHGP